MPRISGVNLPLDKKIEVALTYIFGIGKTTANKILKSTKINPNTKSKDLTENDVEKIKAEIEKNYKVEGGLKAEIGANIKRLKDTGCWRGLRHSKNLPTRGQRTRSNARTKRGRKVTMATSKKVVSEKT
ncbi:MAG: 30S ribosomal protein S13 [Candidatus Berkelbacteria bacterium]|nr:30S ribosomal protein S13 [Candidatus Berkelbacteria bacterium]